jgi:hypothetical protein
VLIVEDADGDNEAEGVAAALGSKCNDSKLAASAFSSDCNRRSQSSSCSSDSDDAETPKNMACTRGYQQVTPKVQTDMRHRRRGQNEDDENESKSTSSKSESEEPKQQENDDDEPNTLEHQLVPLHSHSNDNKFDENPPSSTDC